jgi:ElaB/YqjD/DUF883 family membrane-anchored ribosome-binding protein
LGYEKIAIRIIQLKGDQSGRSILVQIGQTASPEVKSQADDALKSLDHARLLVDKVEGIQEKDGKIVANDPKTAQETTDAYNRDQPWVTDRAKSLGVSSALGLAILLDAAVQMGPSRAGALADSTSQKVTPPLNTREKEEQWFTEFLNERESNLQQIATRFPQFAKPFQNRILLYRAHLSAGDWDLKQPDTAFQNASNP